MKNKTIKNYFPNNPEDLKRLSEITHVSFIKEETAKVYIRLLSCGFFGLFANKEFKIGEKICDIVGEICEDKSLDKILKKSSLEKKQQISSYLISSPVPGKVIRADQYIRVATNFSRFANLNDSGPNAVISMENDGSVFPCYRAQKKIPIHWQILISYGPLYKMTAPEIPINPAPQGFGLDKPKIYYYSVPIQLSQQDQKYFGLQPFADEVAVFVKLPRFFNIKKYTKNFPIKQSKKLKNISYIEAHLVIPQVNASGENSLETHITSLMWACFQGNIDRIKQLLRCGVDVNAIDRIEKTALAMLIEGKGKPDKCLSLIEEFDNRQSKFNFYVKNKNLLHLAIESAESEVDKLIYVEHLIKDYYYAIMEKNPSSLKNEIDNHIFFCIRFGYIFSLKLLIEHLPEKIINDCLDNKNDQSKKLQDIISKMPSDKVLEIDSFLENFLGRSFFPDIRRKNNLVFISIDKPKEEQRTELSFISISTLSEKTMLPFFTSLSTPPTGPTTTPALNSKKRKFSESSKERPGKVYRS